MRICLDTNVLLSGIFWKGIPGRIIDAWIEEKFDVIVSPSVLEEYISVLRRLGSSVDLSLVEKWIPVIFEKVLTILVPSSSLQWSRDSDDDQFIELALAGKADYLVSGDRDLLDLVGTLPIRIVSPRNFLEIIL